MTINDAFSLEIPSSFLFFFFIKEKLNIIDLNHRLAKYLYWNPMALGSLSLSFLEEFFFFSSSNSSPRDWLIYEHLYKLASHYRAERRKQDRWRIKVTSRVEKIFVFFFFFSSSSSLVLYIFLFSSLSGPLLINR